jgi:LysR family glycine cleavage system transcriptional activator
MYKSPCKIKPIFPKTLFNMDRKRSFPGLRPSFTNAYDQAMGVHVSLESVRVFEAAARHLGFSAAAEELGVTQSAVSQRVKGLEVTLGVTLFRRLPQGLRLTEAGQAYLLDVRPALQRLRAASGRAAARGVRRAGVGKRVLTIGTTPSIGLLCLAPHLAGFRDAFPGVVLRIETNMALVDPQEAGLDCCVRYGPGQWSGVTSDRLAGEDLFPICAPSFVPSGVTLDVAELCAFSLIHDLGPITWIEWLAAFGAVPPPQAEGLAVTDSALAQQAAIDGIGVALGRSRLIARELKAGRVIRPVSQSMPSPFAYFLVRSSARSVDPLLSRFEDWLRREVFA